MRPPEWWLLQGTSLLALLLCTTLAFASSGRVGRHTPYGGFLFVLSLGFWFLVVGLTAYIATVAVGAWHGPPGWGDVFTLTGWGILVVAFHLLLWRFPRPGLDAGPGPARTMLLPLLGGLVLGAAAWIRVAGLAAPDLEGLVRIAYLFLDGVVLVVFALSSGLLVRLRRATLGQLYAILAAGLVLKSLADLAFLAWPDGGPLGLLATALYPMAGLTAVAGLALHHHAVAPLATRRVLAQPGSVPPQLVLRDAAHRMRGLAGALGEHTVLRAAAGALRAAGAAAVVQEGTLAASAPDSAWQAAVSAARARAAALFGRPAEDIFDEVLGTYGQAPPGAAP